MSIALWGKLRELEGRLAQLEATEALRKLEADQKSVPPALPVAPSPPLKTRRLFGHAKAD